MTLYAGWTDMSMSYVYSESQITNPNNYNSSSYAYTISTNYTNSSSRKHLYLVANESGTHYIYYKNSSSTSYYRYYLQIYNLTKSTYIRSNSYVGSTSYNSQSFTCDAGDVIVISIYRYNTSYSGSTAYFYFTGFSSAPSSTTTADCPMSEDLVYSYGSTYEVTVGYGEEYTLPEITRSGYTFDGWYYGGKKVASSGVWDIPPGNDVTLTPQWR